MVLASYNHIRVRRRTLCGTSNAGHLCEVDKPLSWLNYNFMVISVMDWIHLPTDSTLSQEGRSKTMALADDMRALGIQKGDILAVHSSMKSIGGREVAGGADAVITALCLAVGEEGTLLMPAHSYSFQGRKEAAPFHPLHAPSETGLITKRFLEFPQAVRSLHPTHSVVCLGKHAQELVDGHDKVDALGVGSPWHKLWKLGGRVLMLGCGHNANTFVHTCEYVLSVPYGHLFIWAQSGWKEAAEVEGTDGSVSIVPLNNVPGCSEGFPRQLGQQLDDQGKQLRGTVGKAQALLINSNDIMECVRGILDMDGAGLLCLPGECPDGLPYVRKGDPQSPCEIRHAYLRALKN